MVENVPSKRPIYEGSTQFRHWRFSVEQLAKQRETLNAAAIAVISKTIDDDEPGSSTQISFLDADEERTLVKLYLTKIPQLCGHFRFGEEVEATAETYMKRFYLKNTVMDWHPKNVMLTTLFLATKTANQPISLEGYVQQIPKTTPDDILRLEFLVAQSLAFEFAVWPAHRALWGIWLDLTNEMDEAIYDKAKAFIKQSRLTDVELVYTPSQIALACLSLADQSLAQQWAMSRNVNIDNQLLNTIRTIIQEEGKVPPLEVVREIDRRLKLCKNPEKIPGTRAYARRKAEEEAQADEKRRKKADAARKAMDTDDPFGEPLPEQTLDDDD